MLERCLSHSLSNRLEVIHRNAEPVRLTTPIVHLGSQDHGIKFNDLSD